MGRVRKAGSVFFDTFNLHTGLSKNLHYKEIGSLHCLELQKNKNQEKYPKQKYVLFVWSEMCRRIWVRSGQRDFSSMAKGKKPAVNKSKKKNKNKQKMPISAPIGLNRLEIIRSTLAMKDADPFIAEPDWSNLKRTGWFIHIYKKKNSKRKHTSPKKKGVFCTGDYQISLNHSKQ